MKPYRRSVAGFTLLEALIALAVFAMGAVVLGAAYVNVLDSYAIVSRGSAYAQDLAFARGELLAQADLPTAKKGGEFATADGRDVTWTAEITPTGTADLFAVTFTCVFSSLAANEAPRTITESFMLLRPSWSDPADEATLRQAAANRIAKLQGRAQ